MTEQGKNFIDYFNSTKDDLDKKIEKFEELSIDDQYEILCMVAEEKISSDFHWLFNNSGGYNEKHGVGIINIFNNKFPEGIVHMDAYRERGREIPVELYRKMISYEPDERAEGKIAKKGWLKLVENTNIFKDKDGKIDKNKIVEYLSDPMVEINPYHEYDMLFEYLDPEVDRKRNNENY